MRSAHLLTLELEVAFGAMLDIGAGAERDRWLNDMVAVGTGVQTPRGPSYRAFELP